MTGDPASVRIGDSIFVVGNPEGLQGTFTGGLVSAVRSNPDLIQFDAAISPGSSGGALINRRGEVIGVVKSTIMSGQNLNFAVPISKLRRVTTFPTIQPVLLAGAVAYTFRKELHIKGPVKKLIEYVYPRNAETRRTSAAKDPIKSEEWGFDEVGNMVAYRGYDDVTGALTSESTYTYSPAGLRSSQRILDVGNPTPRVDYFSTDEVVKAIVQKRKFSRREDRSDGSTYVYNSGGCLESFTSRMIELIGTGATRDRV